MYIECELHVTGKHNENVHVLQYQGASVAKKKDEENMSNIRENTLGCQPRRKSQKQYDTRVRTTKRRTAIRAN